MLKAGDAAPDFDATDCQGRQVKLSGLKGKKVVLFFFQGLHARLHDRDPEFSRSPGGHRSEERDADWRLARQA